MDECKNRIIYNIARHIVGSTRDNANRHMNNATRCSIMTSDSTKIEVPFDNVAFNVRDRQMSLRITECLFALTTVVSHCRATCVDPKTRDLIYCW